MQLNAQSHKCKAIVVRRALMAEPFNKTSMGIYWSLLKDSWLAARISLFSLTAELWWWEILQWSIVAPAVPTWKSRVWEHGSHRYGNKHNADRKEAYAGQNVCGDENSPLTDRLMELTSSDKHLVPFFRSRVAQEVVGDTTGIQYQHHTK